MDFLQPMRVLIVEDSLPILLVYIFLFILLHFVSHCILSFLGSISAFTQSDIHHDRNCTWIIEVDEVKVVEIEFKSFDVEAHISCIYDYLKV